MSEDKNPESRSVEWAVDGPDKNLEGDTALGLFRQKNFSGVLRRVLDLDMSLGFWFEDNRGANDFGPKKVEKYLLTSDLHLRNSSQKVRKSKVGFRFRKHPIIIILFLL